MKFSKFVKSLAPVGIIFPCEYTEQLNFYTVKEDKNNG